MKIKIKCKQCKKEFWVIPSRKDTAKFCSRDCCGKYGSPRKGKNWEEIYGIDRSNLMKEKRLRALKNNPKIMKDLQKKRRQTLKKNPEIMKIAHKKQKQTINTLKWKETKGKKKIEKQKQTHKDNPNIVKNGLEKRKQTYEDNPNININRIKKMKQTLKNNPDIIINRVKKVKQILIDNPKITIKKIEKWRQTLKNNPNILKQVAKKVSATHQGIELKDWKKFINREPYSQNWDNSFKRKIRKRDNYICLKCGKHQEKEKHSLSVHHINYDKMLTIKENCCTVCRGCNSEVNKNRKHWIKFFQSLLTEKYGYQYEKGNVVLNVKKVKN